MMKNLLIAFVFALMLINPNISIAAESPVDVQEVFVGSETMDGDALKYPKGKAEIRLQRVELAEGGIVPLHSHPIPLLGNVEQGTIVVKRQGMEDLTYTAGDTFIVGPKTPKHTMGNAKTDNAIVWFAAIGAKDVPILIPGINDDQAELLEVQKKNRDWKGWVAPLPNCTTTGLAITLKPLFEKYGAKKVMMTSMQAISGGGKSGVSAMGITDNILPYIPKEENKVKIETRKILGKLKDGKIEDADIKVSCTCTRVPVIDGHTESVFVETEKDIDPNNAKDTYNQYNKEISVEGLPSAPKEYYAFHEDPTRPQPRMEREVGDGMTTSIGRVEKEELFDKGLKYMLFSHNKKMGSAKGAVLLAEMLYKKEKI